MRNFEDFLMDSFEEAVEVEEVVSFGGKERKVVFKAIGADKGDEIRKQCKTVSIYKGQKIAESNQEKFIAKLIVETTVHPDFKNAELQDAWGVRGAEELLAAMKSKMKDGEFGELSNIVTRINGYDKGVQKLVEEAKN